MGSLHEKRWHDWRCCKLIASALCFAYTSLRIKGRTRPGLYSLQTAAYTASAELSLCANVGRAKLATTLDTDSTVNHKQLVKASTGRNIH